MTPLQFIQKWHGNKLSERAGAQSYFNDLCDLLGVEKPNDRDNYCFERGAARTGASGGWADVWKRDCFAWENKAPGKDLSAALRQLMTYALALDNPPLLVVSDREIIQIHTHFTRTTSEVHTIHILDIGSPENLKKLRALFNNPDLFKPQRTTFDVTEEAAARMGGIAKRLADRGNSPQAVAHFLIQCVFCMFAEDVEILPEKLFESILEKSGKDSSKARQRIEALLNTMRDGGSYGADDIPWFNGGLFKVVDVPTLDSVDVAELRSAAKMNWRAIEPAILGTLFERGLNPDMRSQLGAHYTDPATIMKILSPVLEVPLLAEWRSTEAAISSLMEHYRKGGKGSQNAFKEAQSAFVGFLQRLQHFRILDPACGSGNFLYLSLKTLKDLEHRVNLEAEALGLQRQIGIEVSPANVLGIELNPYAAELARATVWIGEIQWMLTHGYPYRDNPILAPLDHIAHKDALIADGNIAEWPACDAIVGNPPFLGDKKMKSEMGDVYVRALRDLYVGEVPGGADLVTYWFARARQQIENGDCKRAGLVATNSIRGGANRKVLNRIAQQIGIFEAWSDEPWVNEGAAVRVSLVAFGDWSGRRLNGQAVDTIYADLTAGDADASLDLTRARRLSDNAKISFMGVTKSGPFDLAGDLARQWLNMPNPHGLPNADVLSPTMNGQDLAKRSSGGWIINFGIRSQKEASLYEAPFKYALDVIKPARLQSKTPSNREVWWRFERARPEMFAAIGDQPRYIATCMVAKHRFFVWLHSRVVPENVVIVIARSDDVTFGILSSRFHQIWAFALGTFMGVGNHSRYTPTTTFETFPFPLGLKPNCVPDDYCNPFKEAIAESARSLNALRERWLNPAEWVDFVRSKVEEAMDYPVRAIAKPGHEADLQKRTLTNLYNVPPHWLTEAHREVDAAVAAAYGWQDYTPAMSDAEILRRLLSLNLAPSSLTTGED